MKRFRGLRNINILRNWFLVVASLIVQTLARSAAQVSDSRRLELTKSYGLGLLRDVTPLASDEKRFMIEYLNRLKREEGLDDDNMLFRLGDEEVTDKWLKVWDKGNQGHGVDFSESGRADIIPRLAPSLFKQEPYRLQGVDIYTLPQSFTCAGIVLAIIKSASVFPLEVVRWAQSINLDDPSNEERVWVSLREAIRQWFKENEDALRSARYSDVKPGKPWNPSRELGPVPTAETAASQPSSAVAQSNSAMLPMAKYIWSAVVVLILLGVAQGVRVRARRRHMKR